MKKNNYFTQKLVTMRKGVFIFIILALSYMANSQSLTPEVIASGGEFLTHGAASLSSTLGEPLIETGYGNTLKVTQGFQQVQTLSVSITSQTDVSCYGGSDGMLIATTADGTANYTYVWSNGESTSNTPYTSDTITGLTVGSYSITVTDGSSNTATASATVTVADNQPPNAVCKNISVYLDNSGQATISGSDIDNNSTDNCSISTRTANPNSFTCINIGPNQVTLTVTDSNNNPATCTATVTVVDTLPPVLTGIPAMDTVVCGQVPNPATVTVTDNCTPNPSLSFTETQIPVACPQSKIITRTWSSIDGHGNSVSQSQTIYVIDTIPPSLVGIPGPLSVECSNIPQPAVVTATDNCDNAPSVTMKQWKTSGSCENSYTLTRTWTASDACSNVDSASQVITVVDATNPVAVCSNPTFYLDEYGNASIIASDLDGGSTDNCTPNNLLTFSATQTSFDCNNVGFVPVTLTAFDECSNTSTCSANITISDTIPPIVLCSDTTLELNANGLASLTAADINNGSTDACGIASVVIDQTNFSCNDLGANTITLTVTDNNNNVSTCTATVTVVDNWNTPVITSQPIGSVNCIENNITLSVTANGSAPISYQWYKDGSPITGSTYDTLILNNLSLSDDGLYHCEISQVCSVIQSDTADVVVNPCLEVCGNISTNTTWNIDTIKVTCDIIVDDDVTLTIMPGTFVEFQGYYMIDVQGNMLAQGTQNDSIYFAPVDTVIGWRGIKLNNSAWGVNGIMNDNDSTILSYCWIGYGVGTGNYEHNRGGGFYVWAFDKVRISNSTITKNSADIGGGMLIYFASIVMKNNTITHNIGTSNGGGLNISHANGVFINNYVAHNTSVYGAGIQLINSQPEFHNNIFEHNHATVYAGALLIQNADVVMENNILRYNSSDGHGAGIFIDSWSQPVINRNCILYNHASDDGGGFFIAEWSISSITNNLIVNNSATDNGGGIFAMANADFTNTNNTIANNIAYNSGGGIYITNSAPVSTNTILYGNQAITSGSQVFRQAGNPDFIHCDIQGGPTFGGSGTYLNNIDSIPRFTNPTTSAGPGGTTANGQPIDWTLTQCSPCVNAGTPDTSGLDLGLIDRVGNQRVYDTAIDMGAYEFIGVDMNPIAFTLHPASTSVFVYDPVSFGATAIGTAPVTYQWYHNNTLMLGETFSSLSIPSAIHTDAGQYFVEASNICGPLNSNVANLTVQLYPVIEAGPDTSICGNLDYMPPASVQNYSTLQWTTSGDGTFDNNSIVATTYFAGPNDILTGSVQINLTANAPVPYTEVSKDSFILTLKPFPEAAIYSNAPVCIGDDLILNGLPREISCLSDCGLPELYCASWATLQFYQYISKFELDDASQVSSFSGYSDFTSAKFKTLYRDSVYALGAEISNPTPALHHTNVFIDWNRDSDFDDPGETIILGSGTGDIQLTGNLQVPAGAALGNTLLRIVNEFNVSPGPCGNYARGETEDYWIEIKAIDAGAYVSYEWTGPASWTSSLQNNILSGVSTLQDGIYYLTVTNTAGCTDVTNIDVIVPDPQIQFPFDTIYTMSPDTLVIVPGAFDTYLWSTGSTSSVLFVDDYGTYTLTVTEYGCEDIDSVVILAIQEIPLRSPDWGIFSTFINTDDSIHHLMAQVAVNNFIIVKDVNGAIFTNYLGIPINSIGKHTVGESYQYNISNPDILYVNGPVVYPELTPIVLQNGYNYLGYLRMTSGPVDQLMSPIEWAIEIIKDEDGQVYWYLPLLGGFLNQIGNLEPDKGYQIKMSSGATYTYPSNDVTFSKHEIFRFNPVYYHIPIATGNNMTLGILQSAWSCEISTGDEIGIFDNDGNLSGSGVYNDDNLAVCLWGDNEFTDQKVGLTNSETFRLQLWRSSCNEILELEVLEWIEGDGTYADNSTAIIGKIGIADQNQLMLNNYPNPFKEVTIIEFSIPESGRVQIDLFNAMGMQIQSIANREYKAGKHTLELNVGDLSVGNYFIRLESNGEAVNKAVQVIR